MNSNVQIDLHDKFELQLVDAKTGIIKGEYQSYNIVLNSFFWGMLVQQSDTWEIMQVAVGTGTGTLDVTRTALFDHKGAAYLTCESFELLDNGVNKVVYYGTFTETQVPFNLTEIGLLGSRGTLATHSLITDSEGNPIAINKTDSDILHVRATVYSKINVSGPFKIYRLTQRTSDGLSDKRYYPTPVQRTLMSAYRDGWSQGTDVSVGGAFIRCSLTASNLWRLNSGYYGNLEACGMTHPIDHYTNYANVSGATAPRADIVGENINTEDSWGLRIKSNIMQSTVGNYSEDPTWLIKSINYSYSNVDIGYFSFPNHDIYPPREFTFTLTGNGEETDFDLPIPEVMKTGVEIKIEGTVIDPSEYEFNGKNFHMGQAWISADNRYMIDTGLSRMINPVPYSRSTGSRYVPVFPFVVGESQEVYERPITYDFQQPIKVNTFAMRGMKTYGGFTENNDYRFTLSYSTDNVSWTDVETISLYEAGNDGSGYSATINPVTKTFSTITARYWRIQFFSNLNVYTDRQDSGTMDNRMRMTSNPQKCLFCGFDYVQPGIKFQTAPADGATITVKCKCEYPIMNTNWRIDPVTVDITLRRTST